MISGLEEARLIHLGVLQAVPGVRPTADPRRHRRRVAPRCSSASSGETLAARSFKLGAVRLTDRFFPGGGCIPTRGRRVPVVRPLVARRVRARGRSDIGFDIAVASSGTAETIARHRGRRREATPALHTFNRFEFTHAELDAVVDSLLAKAPTPASPATIPGLEAGRADIIVAGALVLQSVADAFGDAGVDVQRRRAARGRAARHDRAARGGGAAATTCATCSRPVRRARRALRRRHRPLGARRRAGAAAVRRDAVVHGLTDATAATTSRRRRCSPTSALVISHSKHHLHSYYVIRNSELAGLTDHEIEMIALGRPLPPQERAEAEPTEFGG